MIFPSKIFTEKEKEVARDIYFLTSQTYLDILDPFADKKKIKENIIKWKSKLEELLDMLEG